jgi:hypothetical protein
LCQQSPTLEYLTLKIKANPNVHKETGTHLRTKKQTIDFNSQTKSQALFESCTCGLHTHRNKSEQIQVKKAHREGL